MKNVIVDPGIIPIEYVKEACRISKYKVFFIQLEVRFNDIVKEWPEVKETYPFEMYNDFKEVHELKHPEFVKEHYTSVFNAVISDYRTHIISERVNYRKWPWINCFNDIVIISNLVSNYLDWLSDVNPMFVFFESTPHEICSFVLGKVAELIKIPVYMMDLRLPWKSYLVRGVDEHIPSDSIIANQNDTLFIDSYYKNLSGAYKDGISPYEKEQIEKRKGKLWSWRKEIKEPLLRPHRFVALFRKYSLYKYYQTLLSTNLPGDNYVVVFLHFQPERNTIPEALFFSQQFNLIRTIQLALPNHKILVKEHPAEFVGHFDIRYRNKHFYKSIAALNNVMLIDPTIDTFSLVDNALCVATVKGTVGLQALIRGKQVLCFGLANYSDFEGCYMIRCCEDVEKAVKDIETKNADKNYNVSELTLKKLHELDSTTVSGIIDRTNIGELRYNKEYKLVADGILLQLLLSESVK